MVLFRNLAARGFTEAGDLKNLNQGFKGLVQGVAEKGFTGGGPATNPFPTPAPQASRNEVHPLFKNLAAGGFPTPSIAADNNKFAVPASSVPGATSTQITISGPTQSEQIYAGIENKPRQERSLWDRDKFGDKDLRSALAEEKVRLVKDIFDNGTPEGKSRDEVVDFLNEIDTGINRENRKMAQDPSYRPDPHYFDLRNNLHQMYGQDAKIMQLMDDANNNKFQRPAFESSDFVGEGQFGRVVEIAPGFVEKRQAPLVEWGGYLDDDPRGVFDGRIDDYRDVQKEFDDINQLNKMHMGPAAYGYNKNDDGSTSYVMEDLSNNFETGFDHIQRNNEAGDFLKNKLFEVKRKQQEAASAHSGLILGDRHPGNVMVNKLTGRPIQLDPSAKRMKDSDPLIDVQSGRRYNRDFNVAQNVAEGFYAADLTDEAEIYSGLFNEAMQRGDEEEMHYLAQSGLSRLQKIKQLPKNYSSVLPSPTSISDPLFDPTIPF